MLAKAIATESEANFISVKGPSLLSMWVGESLPYKEELLVKHNGIIKRMKIGEVVENKIDVEVLAFNKDKKIRFAKINDYIKHPLTGKLLEIKTRTGRRIVVTDYHSVFSFINGIFTDVPASHLIKGESYVAIPKNLNMPEEKLRSINLYNHFKKDGDIYVSKVKEYIERAKKILGLERTAKSLKISKKYVADIIGKNLPVPINLFDNLIKEAKLALTPEEIKIKLKGSVHEYPAIFNIEEDFWRLLGIWIAEGDLNGHTVRIHNQNHAIRQDIINTCKKYNIYISEMETCITLNSRFLQKVFKKVFGMESGANKKRLPTISFTIDKKSKSEMLKGYFSGDGSIYSSRDGKFKIEVGTISKDLANDLMYMLLDFGIVATCYEKPERTGTTTYRISILGVKNFEIFKDIGFIDRKRDKKITQYIESRNWCRSDLIPLSGELYELASQQNKVYSTNYSIGKEKLKSMLVLVDKEKTKYKEYWDLVMGDIFFDMVKEIKVIEGEQYVYDISVPEGQNFIGGFGGIIAHNSERGVRKIFEKARQASPSIIFFDEIDALAPRRGAGTDNHATERVVNQLLTEMDGLDSLQDVVIIAATNRPDIIDPALLRPGRFDRILLTPPPDINGRTEILKVHTAKMPLSQDVNIQEIAEKTEGFVGADIEALCREAAMISLREDMKTKEVSKKHFEEALKIVRPSVTPDITKVYEEIEGQFKGALAKQVKENMPNYFG
ncbi:AAA family ATPase [Candidatus Woesearchaeota archaeon]|nr:AAA family ATPase [Candidatus Woesearchaeota archaeon]